MWDFKRDYPVSGLITRVFPLPLMTVRLYYKILFPGWSLIETVHDGLMVLFRPCKTTTGELR
jgi:hypothetical protein